MILVGSFEAECICVYGAFYSNMSCVLGGDLEGGCSCTRSAEISLWMDTPFTAMALHSMKLCDECVMSIVCFFVGTCGSLHQGKRFSRFIQYLLLAPAILRFPRLLLDSLKVHRGAACWSGFLVRTMSI